MRHCGWQSDSFPSAVIPAIPPGHIPEPCAKTSGSRIRFRIVDSRRQTAPGVSWRRSEQNGSSVEFRSDSFHRTTGITRRNSRPMKRAIGMSARCALGWLSLRTWRTCLSSRPRWRWDWAGARVPRDTHSWQTRASDQYTSPSRPQDPPPRRTALNGRRPVRRGCGRGVPRKDDWHAWSLAMERRGEGELRVLRTRWPPLGP
jgi:hypothetical protein